jgi:hypothetical protein
VELLALGETEPEQVELVGAPHGALLRLGDPPGLDVARLRSSRRVWGTSGSAMVFAFQGAAHLHASPDKGPPSKPSRPQPTWGKRFSQKYPKQIMA